MNLAQSGYHLLMILSVVDGHYSSTEGKIIVQYLMNNYQLNVNIDEENRILLAIDKVDLPEHFKKMANNFLIHSNNEQRLNFIVFAYRLVQADGNFSELENKMLALLATIWNVDIEPLLNDSIIPEALNIKDWGK